MILLDTHVWFWLSAHPGRLSAAARAAIDQASRSGGIAIASVSLVEIAAAMTRGRIMAGGLPEAALNEMLRATAVVVKEITPVVAMLATQFPSTFPGDPADRIIAATATAEGAPLVTRDSKLRRSPFVQTVW
jgi:PIN domain nuclease of toxin-antitoxin system